MQSKSKQAPKTKAYQLLLTIEDAIIFDQLAKQKGLHGATYLRMLVKQEIAQTQPISQPIA